MLILIFMQALLTKSSAVLYNMSTSLQPALGEHLKLACSAAEGYFCDHLSNLGLPEVHLNESFVGVECSAWINAGTQ